MAKTGYLPCFPRYGDGAVDRKWMENFGCDAIMEEQPEERRFHLGLDKLLAGIADGDTLVVTKFAHVVNGASQLAFFLEFCRLKKVRLIALHDGIDTAGELFPGTTVADVLDVVARLPKEANAVRKSVYKSAKFTKGIRVLSQAAYGRAERKKLVVNMYQSGYNIKDIWKASGFKSRSSVFRVLKDEGVELKRTRGKTADK